MQVTTQSKAQGRFVICSLIIDAKKLLVLALLWSASALLPATSFATQLAGPITNPANGHLYYLLDIASWTDAESEAVSLGGHLVTIDNAAENAWVLATFGPLQPLQAGGNGLWIGFNDVVQEGAFVWISGQLPQPPFTNWNGGEPNGGSSENYAAMLSQGLINDGVWNDVPNAGFSGIYGVVEVNPPPAPVPAAAPLGLAASMLLSLAGLAYVYRRQSAP